MTRQEKIQQEANTYESPQMQLVFMQGAEWADKTMLEKACEWLSGIENDTIIVDIKTFIEQFRKDMMLQEQIPYTIEEVRAMVKTIDQLKKRKN